jgi:hypothetical protein
METVYWKCEGKQFKHHSEYFTKTSKNYRINRKDGKGKLIYQFFLDEEGYLKVINHFKQGYSWARYKNSTLHFYGGNYIYCEWSDGFREICRLLELEIKWDK